MYSPGYNFNESHGNYPFIKLNNGENLIVSNDGGYNIVVMDRRDGQIVDSKSFNVSSNSSTNEDSSAVDFIAAIQDTDALILVTVDKEFSNAPNTFSLLQSWGGCNDMDINNATSFHSFIWIGFAQHAIYCEYNEMNHIYKEFNVQITANQTTLYPVNLHQTKIIYKEIPVDNGKSLNLDAATSSQIVMFVLVLIGCCLMPLLISIGICLYIYKRNSKLSANQSELMNSNSLKTKSS